MAATTIYRPFPSPDESLSLRSFRVPTSPPSLKASSLKLRGSLSSFLGARGRSRPPEPTLKDLQAADDFLILDMGLSSSSNIKPNGTIVKSTQTEQATIQRPRSKSRTIIRMLTTKLSPRQRSVSTSPSRNIIRPPPPIANAFGKEQRDAALRERGLLPPLPNKDLSTQEMEQDQFIPVVTSFDEPERPDVVNPSAADLIKKEWVSKNTNGERARMNSFKFGGGVSPVSESFTPDLSTPTAADQAAEGPANADPISPPPVEALPVPTSEPAPPPQPTSPPSLRVDVSAEAYMFPLPPSRSPSPSSAKGGFSFPPPPSPTIPPSPSLRSIPDTPYSLHTSVDAGSGTNTPRPLDIQRDTTPVPPVSSSPPAISLTPPTDHPPPPFVERTESVDDSIISAFHKRTDSFAQLEESISSSATVPSLDASNSTTTSDSIASSSLNADAAATSPTPTKITPTPKGKLGSLTVRTNGAPVIPVIVESPVADRFSNELEVVVEEPLSMLMDSETDKEADDDDNDTKKPVVTSLLTPPQSPRSPGVPSPRKKRGLTDPTGPTDRRKSLSLNPFKRGVTLDQQTSENGDELKPPLSPTSTASRRSSVAVSFSSIRRSVAGSLSSRKGAASPDAKARRFDASHLPPSPTVPSSFRSVSSMGLRSNAGTPVPMRTPVSPVLYSRGSILLETSNIEDEETRNRTEMAFLG